MAEPMTNKELHQLQKRRMIVFRQPIYQYLTKISRSFPSCHFTDFHDICSEVDSLDVTLVKEKSNIDSDSSAGSDSDSSDSGGSDSDVDREPFFLYGFVRLPRLDLIERCFWLPQKYYMYLGETKRVGDVRFVNGSIWNVDNKNRMRLIFSSILDICIVNIYLGYQSVCRWDG